MKHPLPSTKTTRPFPYKSLFKDYASGFTIIELKESLDEYTCQQIGDFHFLNGTADVSNPFNANFHSDLSLLVFKSDVTILKTNQDTIIDLDNKVTEKNKKVQTCLYVRERGILRQLQTWEY